MIRLVLRSRSASRAVLRAPSNAAILLSAGFQFSEQREILLTALRGISFCSSGRGDKRNHDLVSDGFLAVTAAGLVLLCSGLLAIAFG